MRISLVNVGLAGYRNHAQNDRRMGVLEDLMSKLGREDIDLVVLPAGVITVQSEECLPSLFENELAFFKDYGIPVIFGVDVYPEPIPFEARFETDIELPCFSFSWTPNGVHGPWRQRGSQPQKSDSMPVEETQVHVVPIEDQFVGVLTCQEIFNRELQKIYQEDCRIGVVVDVGHIGGGRWNGISSSMRKLLNGISVNHCLACQHLMNKGKHHVLTTGELLEQHRITISEDGDTPWVDAKIYEFK